MTLTTAQTLRVLICDDQAIVCEGLRAILEPVPNLAVVGVANDGLEAIELTRRLQPDLVLMDLKMPKMNGVHATRAIREQFPAVRVLVLTTYDADEWVLDAVRAGAAGYMLKDAPETDLIKAIFETAQGRNPIDPQVAGKVLRQIAERPVPTQPDQARLKPLSDRERDVLRLLATGLGNADIARALFLSEGTVKNYVSGILAKLDVADRTQAALVAMRAGLVGLGDSSPRPGSTHQ
jgi:two-component system, NarL family, response regulator LiaR